MITTLIISKLRPTLSRSLESVRLQNVPSKLIVFGDSGLLPLCKISSCKNKMSVPVETEWLCFLDDDDYFLQNHFEAIKLHPDVDFIVCSNTNSFILAKSTNLKMYLKSGAGIPGPALIIKTNVFRSLKGFNEQLTHSEVWELCCRLLNYKYAIVEEPSWVRNFNPLDSLGQTTPSNEILEWRLKWAQHQPT